MSISLTKWLFFRNLTSTFYKYLRYFFCALCKKKFKLKPSKSSIKEFDASVDISMSGVDARPDCVTISIAATGNIFSEFENEILLQHNKYRALHGCPPLKLNLPLCNYARDWAVLLGHSNSVVNRDRSLYGENLFTAKGYVMNAEEVVQKWYSEIQFYDFHNPGYVPEAKNFTQMIWRRSKELGVGVMRIHKKTWVVANYNPPGNIPGLFEKCVRLRKSDHNDVHSQDEDSDESEDNYEEVEDYDEEEHDYNMTDSTYGQN